MKPLPKYRAWIFWGYLLSVVTGIQLLMWVSNYGNEVKVAKAFYGLCSDSYARYPCHDVTENEYVNWFLNSTSGVGFGQPYWQMVWVSSIFFVVSLIVLIRGLVRKSTFKREVQNRIG